MSGDEVWQLLAEDVVGDPTGVDVVAVANRVDQDNPVAVVGNDVGVSGKRLSQWIIDKVSKVNNWSPKGNFFANKNLNK